MIKIDTCGTSCPQPILMTKKSINNDTKNIEVIVDNNTSKTNVKKYLINQGFNVIIDENKDNFVVRGSK
ncbi:sulfurtransferase TusA family protein [Sedimentibacter sp. zth1]|uniref:sulfurtransferase TusA family protein n=1 Tax=Sedimentibacter sp. zth1 TaxID=2816908 RepID=UPI001A90CC42|nr:sulfurtransferase TusA family protein [Sedimentibacter sp. zth1]QSX07071.1 sulfurtransferase TusA family protein [Sedimentibacter sp. zth1]